MRYRALSIAALVVGLGVWIGGVAMAASPSAALGGRYRGTADNNASVTLSVGNDGLSVQGLVAGQSAPGNFGPNGLPMPPAPGVATPPPAIQMTCPPGGIFTSLTLNVANIPVAGAPIVDEAFYGTGGNEKLTWTAQGQFEGTTVRGTYTANVQGCGEQTVSWTLEHE